MTSQGNVQGGGGCACECPSGGCLSIFRRVDDVTQAMSIFRRVDDVTQAMSIFRRVDDVTQAMSKGGGGCL